MKKRILLPLLAALIVLSLIMSACGGSDTSGGSGDTSPPAVSADGSLPQDDSSTAEESEASEVSYMIKDSYTTDELREMDIDELVAVIYANGYVPPEHSRITEEEKRDMTMSLLEKHRDEMVDYIEGVGILYPGYSYDYNIHILEDAYNVMRKLVGNVGPEFPIILPRE